MKIEHFALQVEHPQEVAAWYVAQFGFRIQRQGGAPAYAHFLADSSGSVMLEIYNNPRVQTPDYYALDPLLVHLAFISDGPAHDRDRLIAAGATLAEDVTETPAGDLVVMLRDPWGFAVQFVKRAEAML